MLRQNTSVKVVAGVVAGVVAAITAVLGVPVTFLQIRKPSVETRKIELEAQKLQEQTGIEYLKDSQATWGLALFLGKRAE
jgi:hypothetical protein